eukprot:TRINITY_DN464_c0_g1_i1.p1 TRINITY_DN464_c0_g1~~TRINITY_DN464_c0_g1_i1.p1  ORF type:complete len:503 (+),score=42.02 TRINITY_DN464_c0_g1_i1:4711-6219(+)
MMLIVINQMKEEEEGSSVMHRVHGNGTIRGKGYHEVENMTEACQLFESSAKRQKDLQFISKYANLYDSIMAKHAEGAKLLQDSVEVVDHEKAKLAEELLGMSNLERSPHRGVQQLAKNVKIHKEVMEYLTSLPYSEVKSTVQKLLKGELDTHLSSIINENAQSFEKINYDSKTPNTAPAKRPQTSSKRYRTPVNALRKRQEEDNLVLSPKIPSSRRHNLKMPQLNRIRFELNQNQIKEKELVASRQIPIYKAYSRLGNMLSRSSERTKPDCAHIYRTFVNYYASVSKNRKTAAGPLDYMAKSHVQSRDKSLLVNAMKYIKVHRRKKLLITNLQQHTTRNEDQERALPKQEKIRVQSVNASYNAQEKIKDLSVLIEKCDKYSKDSRNNFLSFKSHNQNLKKQYVSMKKVLDTSGIIHNSKEIEREIRRNVTRFRRQKVCFIYGSNGKGRYLFAGDNGRVKDRIKEWDCALDSPTALNRKQYGNNNNNNKNKYQLQEMYVIASL